ncbi:uncharacterized protein PAC_04894 [Phialocephala subalpina]|uniref:Uncharacterized protein n=1 Tax=Phialocephala subalpina TaxID=576137 RepID=A0A1L7WQI0_9HELO|nr:uncharacterized protein PAC_04894 [Phialocephala subalpina]
MHAEHEEIKTLIAQLRAKQPKDARKPTRLEQPNTLGPECATDVSHLVLDRINATGSRKWFLELHIPWTKSQALRSVTRSLITRRIRVPPNAKHLVILSSLSDDNVIVIERSMRSRHRRHDDEVQLVIEKGPKFERRPERDVEYGLVRRDLEKDLRKCGGFPPPRSGSSSSSQWPKEKAIARKSAGAEVHLSQQETETAVNDFLATFSSLYDDVSPEERGKVLDSVPLAEDEEEESDDSSTREFRTQRRGRRSSSLVDD